MSSYQFGKSHCGDKTVVRSSYLHNGISYTGKMSSLYWIRALGLLKLAAYPVSWLSSPGCFPSGPCVGFSPVWGNLVSVVRYKLHYDWYQQWVTSFRVRVINIVIEQYCALTHGTYSLISCVWILKLCIVVKCKSIHFNLVSGKFCKSVNCVPCGKFCVMACSPWHCQLRRVLWHMTASIGDYVGLVPTTTSVVVPFVGNSTLHDGIPFVGNSTCSSDERLLVRTHICSSGARIPVGN